MIERLLVLAVIVTAAFLVVSVAERLRPVGVRLRPGITVVTGPGCRLCDGVIAALEAEGVAFRRVAVDHLPHGLTVRSLPTVFVADRSGAIVLRRSGRSAVTDIDVVVATAASDGVVREVA